MKRWTGRLGRLAPHLPALGILVTLAVYELWPMLRRWDTLGFHDWDVGTAQRYLTVLALRGHGELPWWNPFFCGGFPGFGHPEGAPNLVSPWLPAYLLADMPVALRIEVLGSTCIGLAGAYAVAGRVTASPVVRAWVAIVFGLSGRFSLQTAVGHTWHLAYAYLPWALWFFDRALEPNRRRNLLGCGALLALMANVGGIYPLPHTALVLSLYALARAALDRSWAPLAVLASSAATGLGLALPKLAAVADAMLRAPRLVESTEAIGWGQLWIMMTSRLQEYGRWPMSVPRYNWHEWGLYVGPAGVLLLLAGLFAATRRSRAFLVVAVGLLALGFGAFHRFAPWPLLHRLPVFASQHVPSRFLYPMLLLLALAAADTLGRLLERLAAKRAASARWLNAGLTLVVLAYGLDVAHVASRAFEQAFWMELPARISPAPSFEHRQVALVGYRRADVAPPMYPSMLANTGVIQCYGLDPSFKSIGARAVESGEYRDAVFLASAWGSAHLGDWSPNRAVVKLSDVNEPTRLIYNMNWDPSWRAGDRVAENVDHALAAPVGPETREVVFHYVPRTLRWSLPVSVLTLLASAFALLRRRARQT